MPSDSSNKKAPREPIFGPNAKPLFIQFAVGGLTAWLLIKIHFGQFIVSLLLSLWSALRAAF